MSGRRVPPTLARRGLVVILAALTTPLVPAFAEGAGHRDGASLTSIGRVVNVAAVMSRRRPAEPGLGAPSTESAVSSEGIRPLVVAPTSPGIASSHGSYGWNDYLANCGAQPCYEPPNAGIAAGTKGVVDWTDEGLEFDGLNGSFLGLIDRQTFFGEPAETTQGGEISVVWDSLHGRWLATEVSTDCVNSELYLAVSTSDDPTGTWKVYTWAYSGTRPARPTIGTTSDKILLAADTGAIGSCSSPVNNGPGTLMVADTTSVYALPPTLATVTVSNDSPSTMRPAVSQSATKTAFIVYQYQTNGYTTDVGYATVTGTVAGGDVAWTNSTDLTTIGLASLPLAMPRYSMSDGTSAAGAPVAAIWNSGKLWFAQTYSCQSACVEAVQLDTSAPSAPTVSQVINVDDGMVPTFAPGITVSGDGSFWLAMARKNETGKVQAFAAYRAADDPLGTIRAPARLFSGFGGYAGQRWGPSSGIAADPTDPTAVWQHGAASDAGGGWITRLSRLNDGRTAAPYGAVLLAGGAASTVYLGVHLTLTPAASAGVTEVLISNNSSMNPYLELPYSDYWDWQLDDLSAGGSKTTGPRAVYAKWGDGAGNWSPVASGTISVVPSVPVTRLSGADRYATAAAISAATFSPGVPYVFIASGLNFPDALAGASPAGSSGSPILFVGATVPQATITELQRLKPEKIVVLGSAGVVSGAIATSLAGYATSHTVIRLAGPDRFATAAAISKWAYPEGASYVFIAYGYNFPDALAAAPVAGIDGVPILFSATSSIPAATSAELLRLRPSMIIIVGGPSVISTAVENQLRTYAGSGGVGRLAGTDRYGTAATIVKWAFTPQVDGAFIASGMNFPDALAGAAAAAWIGCPILFVGKTLPSVTAYELDNLQPKQDWMLGGSSVVSTTIATQLSQHLGP